MAKLPKPTIKQIRDYRQELVGTDGAGGFYDKLREQQKTDQQYYDDEFKTNIPDPYHVIRTGSMARICDAVIWHIDTSNPQAKQEPRKVDQTEQDRAAKITRLLNHFLPYMVEEIGEATKKANKRGEAFGHTEYNPHSKNGFPFIFTSPDPMIVYPDPSESAYVPKKAIKSCRMTVSQVKQSHPDWTNPQKRPLADKEGVDYFAYWDEDWRYFEADGEPLLQGGIQPNIFGIPFSHCYSGYGEKSPEGRPETKAVGLIKKLRGRAKEECEIESRIDSQIGLFTNPVVKLVQTQPDAAAPPTQEELDFGPGRIIQIPYGWDVQIIQGEVPSAQMFQHLYQIKQALGVELPPIALGLPSTSRATGRQEDIYGEHYRRRYDKLIDSIEKLVSTSLSQMLKALYTIPGALPITIRATVIEKGKQVRKEETIKREDIDGYYECQVRLKAEDEGASNVKFQKYRLLANENRITHKTLLTEGLGWTEDRAQEEITNFLADLAWRTNPMLLEMALKEALEESGRGKLLRQIEEQERMQSQMQSALSTMPPAQGRPSEATNPTALAGARELLNEVPRATRQSSAGYEQVV